MEGPPRQEGATQGSDSGDTQPESWWQQERRKYNPFAFGRKNNTSERKIYFTQPEDFQVPEEEQEQSDEDDQEISDTEQEHTRQGEDGPFADFFREIRIRGGEIEGPLTGEGDVEFKKKMRQMLFDTKYKIQEEDYKQVKKFREEKEKTKGVGYEPLRQNRGWRKARKSYEAAWEDLRTWAKEHNVWDEDDEREYRKESGLEIHSNLSDTLKIMGRNTVGGLLYGTGYAMFNAPAKGIKLTLEAILPYFLDNATSKKMIEAIFGKDDKKEKGGKKEGKKGPDLAKEFETKGKVKDAHIAYLRYIRKNITEEKLRESNTAEQYEALTLEEREPLENNALKELGNTKEVSAYKKAWIDMRKYWIAEEVWKNENEEEFRKDVIDFDSNDKEQVRMYMLTPNEFNNLERLEEKLIKQQKITNDTEFKEQEKEWRDVMEEIKKMERENDPAKQDALEALKRDAKSKRKPIALRNNLHKQIDTLEELAEKRANDETYSLWPMFSKNTKESASQEALVTQTQDQDDED